jgi:outer membrane protein assembly factor BamB
MRQKISMLIYSIFPRFFALTMVGALTFLTACDTEKKTKIAPGDRFDVVFSPGAIKPDDSVAGDAIEIPDDGELTNWINHNDAMLTPHIALTGISNHDSAIVGDGARFSRDEIPAPIVIDGMVVAMDGAGMASAHDANMISTILWSNNLADDALVNEVLGGGLAVADGVIYATAGFGNLRAIELKTGKTLWSTRVGAPVRGAPAIATDAKRVIVLTADNQTLAYDLATGQPRWQHRGIRESAGYFSTTAPVVSEGIVVSAYSSGEVFSLRAETGNVLWSDTIASPLRTNAAAVFNGIDSDPIVQDGVVVVTNSTGAMQASALLNGRPLWQQKIGSHTTPWSAGNTLFVLSSNHDLVAILKRDGKVRWAKSLAVKDKNKKDITPPLYGPILAGNAVIVISGDGELLTFRPQDGAELDRYDIVDDAASAPVIARGSLYLMTKDARLHKYY